MRNFRRVTPVCALSLAVIFILAFAFAAAADDWAAPALALVKKIAEKLRVGQTVGFSLQNLSSLSPDDAAQVRKALVAALRAQGVRVKSNGRKTAAAREEGAAEIRVTLGENTHGLLWVAEIENEDARDVVMEEVARPAAPESTTGIPAMLLRSEKILEQGTPILDLALVDLPGPAGAARVLLVLEPGMLAAYSLEQGHAQPRERMPVPPATPQRDLRGGLLIARQSIQVVLPGVGCYGAREQSLTLTCESFSTLARPWDESGANILLASRISSYSVARFEIKGKGMELEAGSDGLARLYKSEDGKASATFSGWGSELAALKTGCGSGWQILTSRASDWTERDAVQAVEIAEQQAVAVSPALEMDGPVMKLHTSESQDSAFAVVRNLQTGRYEAYVLSLSCGH